MMGRLLLLAILLGVLARVVIATQHVHPRGDVLLDVGVARSLAQGSGFHSGFDRGTSQARGNEPLLRQDLADQHPPLWPLLGAAGSAVTGSAFGGLKLASLLCGLLALALVWRQADRLTEGVNGAPDGLPALACAAVALCFVAIDSSGNGSLYAAQACLVLLLMEWLAAERPSAVRIGLVLGAAWLLNYQSLVLLPVPLLVLLLAPPGGARGRALLVGCGAVAVAAAVQLPWWWRNVAVFGSPFHSTNALYALNAAGVQAVASVVDGVPVVRFPDVSLPLALLRGAGGWVPGNVLYLFGSGLLLWPGLLGLALAGLPLLLLRGVRHADRRLLTAIVSLGVLLAIALAWPGMKLRYLVPCTPLVVLLGVRVLATVPTRGERRLALLVTLGWAALLLATLGDLTGSEAQPRPERWKLMAASGAVFLVLPLLLRHTRLAGRGLSLALCSGVLAMPVLALLALLPWPHTAYHSAVLVPDVYGQQKESIDARAAATAAAARPALRAAVAALRDGRALAGPFELLAFGELPLVSLPYGAGSQIGDDALAALVDAGRVGAVFTYSLQGWPEALAVGDTWLSGRLRVIETWAPQDGPPGMAGAMLSVIVR